MHQSGERFQEILQRYIPEQILVGERKQESAFLPCDRDIPARSPAFKKLCIFFEFLVFDQLVDELLPGIFVLFVEFDINGKQHPALDGEQFRRHFVETRHRTEIHVLMMGKIVDELVCDLRNGDVIYVHFRLLDHVQK